MLAEPDGTHSFDCIWQSSECCFTFLFSVCYGLPVGLCHLFISCYWGIAYGLQAFLHVWYATPFLRKLALLLHVPSCCYRLCTRCLLDPWCEAASYMFVLFVDPQDVEMGFDKDGGAPVWRPIPMF